MFGEPAVSAQRDGCAEEDGLVISAMPLKVIELPAPREEVSEKMAALELDWLSQPLSARTLAWTVNTLVVLAGLLLFMLVFLSVNRETPRWPLAMTGGAVVLVGLMYWGFFEVVGGRSFGERLARLARSDGEQAEDRDARFR
jgi:hypothetical protein